MTSQPLWSGTPRWYLWDGGFLALGRTEGRVPPHSHHALQVVIAIDGTVKVRSRDEEWTTATGFIVRPDVPHEFDPNASLGAMIFVDPESAEGVWLSTGVTEDITIVPESRLTSAVAALRTFLERPMEAMELGALVRHCVEQLCATPRPSRRIDERVTKVLQQLAESEDLRISLEDASAQVFLSPSRFAHLFKLQVGLPFRRYVLWRKLSRAMIAIARERTFAAAAQGSDFADAAHLTRTFNQMFGLTPSVMMRGEFFEIASPFSISR